MSSLRRDLGARIAELREQRRIDAKTFAAASGLSRQMVGCIERGDNNTTCEVLERFAAILGCDAADMFNFPGKHRRHYARELVRLTPSDKLDGLIAAIEGYISAEVPIAGAILTAQRRSTPL
jgi:transcriptional regulator with XRE-family HTH domain